ncbi:MAG: KH domain-containing protein [Myxococcota bacterium]
MSGHDEALFQQLRAQYPGCDIAEVEVEGDVVRVHTARPGLLIGKRGATAERLTAELKGARGEATSLQILEVRRPELEALLVADHVANNVAARVPLERLQRFAQNPLRAGALGCRVVVTGALEADFSAGVLEGAVVKTATVSGSLRPQAEEVDAPLPSFSVTVTLALPEPR